MHRPINYGSALQAWATLKLVEGLGYKPELIDYIYPNKDHIKKVPLTKRLIHFCIQALIGFPWAKKAKKFKQFWKTNYSLSEEFPTRDSINSRIPEYDIFLVGSDQVWNPKMIKGDTTFLLDFVSPKRERLVCPQASLLTNYR